MKNHDQIKVIVRDLSTHPHCEHGPTLLFSRQSKVTGREEKFYACSACRDRSECPFFQAEDASVVQMTDRPTKPFESAITIDEVMRLKLSQRCYCYTCCVFVRPNLEAVHDRHEVQRDISDAQLVRPTTFLRPMSNDKREAQYFFDEASLKCFANIFRQLKINKVICIGAPRLHEYLKCLLPSLGIHSVLLDFDHRFHAFRSIPRSDYFHYNMFNNYFFGGPESIAEFERSLVESVDDRCCIFTDPPFGCRTEPLAHTIRTLADRYRQLNRFHHILPVFHIFPYFMGTYVQASMPEMEMVDYKVNYTNHDTYHTGQNGRKQGSPVRMFTNIPLDAIELPSSERYRYCRKCKRWVAAENRHCAACQTCPSKNGDTYVHCRSCDTCVKPSYKHCEKCRRCTQVANHQCDEYQRNIQCNICLVRGHIEVNCSKWFAMCGKSGQHVTKLKAKAMRHKQSCCFVCFKMGHTEKQCKHRSSILGETSFMGKITNRLTPAEETDE